MATKITKDGIESYLKCKTKAYLKASGKQGTDSEYGSLLAEMNSETREKVSEWIRSRHEAGAVL